MCKSIKIGNRVSPINDNLKGRVIAIDGNSITIEDEDGFERIYDKNELVVYDTKLADDQSIIAKNSNIKKPKSANNNLNIIDLHLSNSNVNTNHILENQLQVFYTQINKAIQHKKSKITFIHGVGEGVLRKRIEKILTNKNIPFSQADYHVYGQGAIIIFLKGITKQLLKR